MIEPRRTGEVALLLVLLAGGCASPQPMGPRAYPGALDPPATHPGGFLDRQKVVARYGDREVTFDAVLQKHDDELLLLGMTPFGSRAFVVRQTGHDVSFDTYVAQTLAFPPRYILIDVHRVFLAGLAPAGSAFSDGAHEAARDGEIVTEQWQGGRLRERRFRRADGDPPGEIRVDYGDGMAADGTPPAHLSLYNGWLGYRIDITTLSHQPL